jgi:hypothetical protein
MVAGLIIQGQLPVLVATVVISVLTVVLAAYLTKAYLKRRTTNYLFWALGLWVFAVSTVLEIVYAAGTYNAPLIDAYLVLVVILVELLALGSITSVKRSWIRKAYYAYVVAITLFTAYSVIATNSGKLLRDYVVAANPPLLVIVASSLATFPAAIVLIVMAIKGYLATKNVKLLSIIAGVIIVSIAGTLYIVSFPAFLYISEFLGILLLWFGFFSFGKSKSK